MDQIRSQLNCDLGADHTAQLLRNQHGCGIFAQMKWKSLVEQCPTWLAAVPVQRTERTGDGIAIDDRFIGQVFAEG